MRKYFKIVSIVLSFGFPVSLMAEKSKQETNAKEAVSQSQDKNQVGDKEEKQTADKDLKRIEVNTSKSELKINSSAPGESFKGLTKKLKGKFRIDIDDFETFEGKIWFPVKSLRTGNSLRDRDMRAKPWLYAEKHPIVSYRARQLNSASIQRKDGQIKVEGKTKGSASVRGTSAPTKADIKVAVLPAKKLVRIKGTLQVSLKDHDVPGEGGAIGDKVGEVIDVNVLVYGSWE